MKQFDVIIIGAGIAGASLAFRLAPQAKVLLLEMEDQPGRHATGRSAAFFSETYGNETIRRLTTASRDFYENPPLGFAEAPLLEPCGALHIGTDDQAEKLDTHFTTTRALAPNLERRGGAFAKSKVPVLNEDIITGSVWEPESQAINVNALHQGFLKGATRAGADLAVKAEVTSLTQTKDNWQVETTAGNFEGRNLVNAAGAWAGEIGQLAGATALEMTPFRRSVCVIDPAKAEGVEGEISDWPLTIDIEERFYFKPSGGTLWLSPADETPSPPCDAQAEEMDIAVAVHRLEEATSLRVRRIEHQWAGLRTFAGDRTPVAGFDPKRQGFFWLAGQGGYGIQTAPALSEVAAHLLGYGQVPETLRAPKEVLAALDPERFAS